MLSLRAVDLIIKKKQGLALNQDEIHFLIQGYLSGNIPDYQISSLLMAICFQGLNENEQLALTLEMLNSGEQIDLSSINGICVDKHSTGGVGDKTTLIVAPIVASCGLKIAKMSGRGLGHTGGTLDKLEAIPGFQIALSPEDFLNQVSEIGLAVVGQTANIAPADKKLYALRDVTGTIEAVGLIASSVMSKKLASGASHILLDVKVGDGAFMKTLEDARTLASAMVKIGNLANRQTVAVLTDMEQPLGFAVGNAIEVIEAIDTLKGQGPKDLTELCYQLSAQMLLLTKIVSSKEEGLTKVKQAISSGQALDNFRKMIQYQHGNDHVIDDYALFAQSKQQIKVYAKTDGYIKQVKALAIGQAAMLLGAGREKKEDIISMGVGVKAFGKVGDFVRRNDVLAILYANEQNIDEAFQMVNDAFIITKEEVASKAIILDVIK
ncbi:MAG: pyrimidine-nucleoside phosphorylase [Bacilli bacterium]